MTSAVLKTDTIQGATIGAGAATTTSGLVEGVYTATIVTTKDWVVLAEFEAIKYVHAYITATGVDAEAYVDGTDTTKVFLTGTGAITIVVKGTSAIEN